MLEKHDRGGSKIKVRRDYRSQMAFVKLIQIFSNVWSSSSSSFSNLLTTFRHRYHYFSIKKGPLKGILGISNEEMKVKFHYFWEK